MRPLNFSFTKNIPRKTTCLRGILAEDSINDTMHPTKPESPKGYKMPPFGEVARYNKHNKENTVNTSATIVKYNGNNKVIFAILIF